ncbi:putative protein TPRXL [Patiria miniata]|uniref:Death domain-containing protein n=1 Tax=Patiria miniata TaxID=46514 RepID=A0A913Z215_PATMI|nr:putative protein TPRXL [Patiria miniata]
MIPTLSAAMVVVCLAGLISLVGYILLERRQTGTATRQGHIATSSNAKSTSRSPSQIPSTQASAATGQGDVATSSPSTKPTNPSPSLIPSTQASDSSQGTGATESNHGVDDSNKPTVDGLGQVKSADSPQGTGAIETNLGVDDSNEATVDASEQVKSAAAARQGDVATSSKNAKPTSQSPSKIPSTKASASTRKEDIATSSPKSKPTSPSPSQIPSTQASGVHALMDTPKPQHSQAPDQQPRLDDKTLQEVATRLGCDWTKLALVLGFESVQVQTIERNYQSNITRQGLEMLVTWKQAQSTSVEQQWYRLCTALEKIGRADVARFQNGTDHF